MKCKVKRIRMQFYSRLQLWRLSITIGVNGLSPVDYTLERIKFDTDYDHKNKKPEEIPTPIFGFIFYRKVNYLDLITSRLHFRIYLWRWEYRSERLNDGVKGIHPDNIIEDDLKKDD